MGTDPGEDPVAETDDGSCRRNEAAHLRQQHNDAGLPQVGRLSRHVRPAEQDNLLITRIEPQVVGHEAAGSKCRFDQRVTAVDDLDPRFIAQDRSYPAVTRRHGAERGDSIELPEPGTGIEQVLAGGGDAPADLAEECLLAGDRCALRVENQRLLLLELGRQIALAVDERLLAHVLPRDRFPVGVADLDVVAEHLVVRSVPERRSSRGRPWIRPEDCRAQHRTRP